MHLPDRDCQEVSSHNDHKYPAKTNGHDSRVESIIQCNRNGTSDASSGVLWQIKVRSMFIQF